MAILRSRAVTEGPVAIANPAVDQALGIWRQRVEAAREEGRQAGLAEAKQTLAEAQQERAAAANDVRQAEQQAQARIDAERQHINEEVGIVLASIMEIAAEHEQLRGEVLRAAEREVVNLGCALAARILRHEVHNDPAWIEDLLAEALALAPDKRCVLLRVHPSDAALLDEQLPVVEQRAGIAGAVELRADEHLARGSCIIESGGTSIDASVAGSWQRLREQLLLAAPGDHWARAAASEAADARKRLDAKLDAVVVDQPAEAVDETEHSVEAQGETDGEEPVDPDVPSEDDAP